MEKQEQYLWHISWKKFAGDFTGEWVTSEKLHDFPKVTQEICNTSGNWVFVF